MLAFSKGKGGPWLYVFTVFAIHFYFNSHLMNTCFVVLMGNRFLLKNLLNELLVMYISARSTGGSGAFECSIFLIKKLLNIYVYGLHIYDAFGQTSRLWSYSCWL